MFGDDRYDIVPKEDIDAFVEDLFRSDGPATGTGGSSVLLGASRLTQTNPDGTISTIPGARRRGEWETSSGIIIPYHFIIPYNHTISHHHAYHHPYHLIPPSRMERSCNGRNHSNYSNHCQRLLHNYAKKLVYLK